MKKNNTTTTTTTIAKTDAIYATMKAAEDRLVAMMLAKGKATLTAEEKAEGFGTLDSPLQKTVLQNATAAFKVRRKVEKLNAFFEGKVTVRIPGTTTLFALTPVAYQTSQGTILTLEGVTSQCTAVVVYDKRNGQLACHFVTKGNAAKDELSIAASRRAMKEFVTSKVANGLRSAINDTLAGLTFDDIEKAVLRYGKVKDARGVNEDMAKLANFDFEDVKREAKKLRTCKVTKAVKTA